MVTWPISSSNRFEEGLQLERMTSMDLRNHVLVVPVAPHDLHEGQVVPFGDENSQLLEPHREGPDLIS